MKRITMMFALLAQPALASTILSFNPQTQVLRLVTEVHSGNSIGPPETGSGSWSGTAYIRLIGIDQMFPPNTSINLEATIPIVLTVDSSHPHFAVGFACVWGTCSWHQELQIRFGGYFHTDPNRTELLLATPSIEIHTEGSAGWNYRNGYQTDVRSSVSILFGQMTLLEGHCCESGCALQDLTNVIPFSVARFEPEIPSPEPGTVGLTTCALLIFGMIARSRFRQR